MYAPTRNAISSHTSGCGSKRHGSTAASVATSANTRGSSSVAEELERGEERHVAAHGEEQPRVEEEAEPLAVELQVHEEQHDHEELDHHQDDEQRQERGADVDVADAHLEAREDGEDDRDLDVEAVL